MAETSWPWPGSGVTAIGDANIAPYTHTFFAQQFMRFVLTYDRTVEGVIDTGQAGYTGGLIVNAGTDQVTIQTGAGIVDGAQYWSDAAKVLAIDPAVTNPRTDLVVMRKHYSPADPLHPYAIRTVVIKNPVETTVPPAYVQDVTGATYWDIPLAEVTAAVGGGAVTVVNVARVVRTPLGPGYQEATLATDDNTHTPVAWNSLGTGVTISLGPGKWLITGQVSYTDATTTAGSRAARAYDNTLGVQVTTGQMRCEGNGGDFSIPLRPKVYDVAVVTEIELQFYAIDAGDRVNGDAAAAPVNDGTGIVATRVI